VIIFDSVWFLPIKNYQTKKNLKPNRNQPKPTGFGSVFAGQNPKNLYVIFWAFFGFVMGF
jgi:hypothetical protein